MRNPFDPSEYIYWLSCPTHQVNIILIVFLTDLFIAKNMINALFSSKHGGTKSFQLDGVHFE